MVMVQPIANPRVVVRGRDFLWSSGCSCERYATLGWCGYIEVLTYVYMGCGGASMAGLTAPSRLQLVFFLEDGREGEGKGKGTIFVSKYLLTPGILPARWRGRSVVLSYRMRMLAVPVWIYVAALVVTKPYNTPHPP